MGALLALPALAIESPNTLLADLSAAAHDPSTAGRKVFCPKAVSIYAMQKTGSTFLSRFSREVALHRKMCRTYQNTKEFVCQTTMYVDCPRNKQHTKTVSLVQTFDTQLDLEAGSPRGPRCNQTLRQRMFREANDWLRSTEVRVKYRYNRSLTWLLSAEGFLRTSRQLYVEHTDGAVPGFPGYHNVVIVHTRHPVEMMVSAFNCIANPKVCPVRSKFLGSHVPKNDTIKSLDDFVLGFRRQGSTPWQIVQRNLQITRFMQGFAESPISRRLPTAPGCAGSTLLHSKYELMVTNFTLWAAEFLEVMIAPKGQRRALHTSLVAQYKNDFVPDGKHKNSLTAGSNMRKLKRSTVKELTIDPTLNALLRGMGYDWFGHDRVDHTSTHGPP